MRLTIQDKTQKKTGLKPFQILRKEKKIRKFKIYPMNLLQGADSLYKLQIPLNI